MLGDQNVARRRGEVDLHRADLRFGLRLDEEAHDADRDAALYARDDEARWWRWWPSPARCRGRPRPTLLRFVPPHLSERSLSSPIAMMPVTVPTAGRRADAEADRAQVETWNLLGAARRRHHRRLRSLLPPAGRPCLAGRDRDLDARRAVGDDVLCRASHARSVGDATAVSSIFTLARLWRQGSSGWPSLASSSLPSASAFETGLRWRADRSATRGSFTRSLRPTVSCLDELADCLLRLRDLVAGGRHVH